jgi:hypothetical protein
MTRILSLLAIGMLAAAGNLVQARTLEILEQAHELKLVNVTFPTGPFGTVIFRACADCDPQSAAINTSTRFLTTAGPTGQQDFLARVADLRQANAAADTSLTIFCSAADGSVTRIVLQTGD